MRATPESARPDPAGPPATERPTGTEKTRSVLPFLGLPIGIWAIIPPYVKGFGDLNVESRVEFADHVVPGIAVLVVSLVGVLALRAADPSQLVLFVCGGVVALAGLWMVATHAPLITQYQDDLVVGGAVIWHGLPGVVVALLGVVWVLRFWGSDADEAASAR